MKWILCDINATWPTVFCVFSLSFILFLFKLTFFEKKFEMGQKLSKWSKRKKKIRIYSTHNWKLDKSNFRRFGDPVLLLLRPGSFIWFSFESLNWMKIPNNNLKSREMKQKKEKKRKERRKLEEVGRSDVYI